jgi:hypothetical protein
VQVDKSGTVVFWNDEIDLPADAIYEFGKSIESLEQKNEQPQ